MTEERKTCGTKSRHFYAVGEWMHENMPRRYVATYACVLAMQRAGMSCSAPEIARRLRRSEGTVRAHFQVIARLALWAPQIRYREGARIANTYIFARLPGMPETVAAEPFVVPILPGTPAPIHEARRITERGSLVETRPRGDAANDQQPLPEAVGHKRKEKNEEQHNSEQVAGLDLPMPLQLALKRAFAGEVRPCLGVLRQETSKLSQAAAKPIRIDVLQQLCDAAKRGKVRSAPALTRTIARAMLSEGQTEPVGRSSHVAELVAIDDVLAQPRSPSATRRTALERARLYIDASELDSELAQSLPAVPTLPGGRGLIVGEMVRAQLEFLRASRMHDGLKENEARCRLDALVEELRRVIAAEREAAE